MNPLPPTNSSSDWKHTVRIDSDVHALMVNQWTIFYASRYEDEPVTDDDIQQALRTANKVIRHLGLETPYE